MNIIPFVVDAIESDLDGIDAIAERELAAWVAERWPVGWDLPQEDTVLVERVNYCLGSHGSSIPEWLGHFPGVPGLLSACIEILRTVREDEMVAYTLDRHKGRVYTELGVGPEELLRQFQYSLECHLSLRQLPQLTTTAVNTNSAIDLVLQEEAMVDEESSVFPLMMQNAATGVALLRHSLLARIAA